jgi:ATP-dependent DNA ligase
MTEYGLSLQTEPMEARSADQLPVDDGPWQYEPKWDGFRCLAFKSPDGVELRAKSGKPLGRYFPEVVAMVHDLSSKRFVLDGELVVEIDGHLAFDALQMRLHPAESRIRKLSQATPARLGTFDMLMTSDGRPLLDQTLRQRRARLEKFMQRASIPKRLMLSPATQDRRTAERWLRQSGHGATDGVVAKRMDDSLHPG